MRGHIIIEDFPGVGKTMLAKSIARSLDCEFARVQATPDLLPSDITGVSVFNLQGDEFEFKPGPVFANLVLVDEINRASPKTQSALLECMQEAQVTVDGHTHPLARPFMVIATQNPIEYEGTFPLPEAQLDRFTMLLTLGYPGPAEEATMLSEHAAGEPLEALEAVTTAPEIEAAIAAVKEVFVEDSLHRYVVAILRHTRGDARLALGASPRSGISLLRVAKAYAALRGRDYVIPSDVKDVAADVLSHRVILAAESRTAGVLSARHRAGGRRPHAGTGVSVARVLTRTGKRTLAAAVVLYFAAWGFGTDVMFPIAVGLMVAPLVALVWVRTFTRPVRMRRTLAQHELVEGTTVVIGLEVRPEAGPLPARATLIDHLGDDLELTAELVRVGHRLRGSHRLESQRRAVATGCTAPSWCCLIRSGWPARRSSSIAPTRCSCIRGCTSSTACSPTPARAAGDAPRMLLHRTSGYDLHSIRDYQHGESLRRVHWRSTARRRRLMVKELEDSPRDEAAVLLDADASGQIGPRGQHQLRRRRCGPRRRC